MMSESVRITAPAEVEAVRNGAILGDEYRDGEVWADAESLLRFRQVNALDQDNAVAGAA
jgi:hypothetical protein